MPKKQAKIKTTVNEKKERGCGNVEKSKITSDTTHLTRLDSCPDCGNKLDELLKWKNPNDTLEEVIKKVHRQKEYILIFIKHEGVPHHNNYGDTLSKKAL